MFSILKTSFLPLASSGMKSAAAPTTRSSLRLELACSEDTSHSLGNDEGAAAEDDDGRAESRHDEKYCWNTDGSAPATTR